MIKKYKTVFAKNKYDVGTVTGYEAHIDLLVDKYCSKRPYKCTIDGKREIEEQVAKLLEKNLIEDSYGPFAAPVTMAFKKDENKKSRLCIDFRELNKIVVPQSQPFPLIDDLIPLTRNCKYYTTLDINSAFWSIPLKIEDRRKTGFVTQNGHFQWTCLPFGLKTAPATFQRILSSILRKNNLTFAVNYIDDILILLKTFEEHIRYVQQVLEAIITEGFRLKFKKCVFAESSVKYLGHMIENNSVRPLKDNLTSIKDFPTPKTKKNIRQFLGKINFYHEYIPNSAIILDPLYKLLRKNEEFVWTEKCEECFGQIKKLLCSQPVLEIFDNDLPVKIFTDASLEGIGAILKQTQPDITDKPVAYFSKKLNETQKRKKAIYLECLAIKEAIKYWQHWLIGRRFTVYSDHKPLEYMNIKARTDEELGDLTYYLSQYDFVIKYIPGKENIEADCLSRNPVLGAEENKDEVLKTVNSIKIDNIMTDQENNEEIKKLRNVIKKHNIYYRKIQKKEKIILSEDFSKKIIKQTHEDLCHIGIRQLHRQISPIYTAKNLTKNIISCCKTCETCIKNKTRGHRKLGLMSHLGPATKPFEIMSLDTIGGFGGSRSTKKYLHLLVDHFTRYAFIVTSKTQSAGDFIKLVKDVIKTDEIGIILTDQYPGIKSKEFKEFLVKNNITLIFTAVNTPFSNGLNERLNQTLVNKIRCKMNENKQNKKTWTTIARECVNKYNETQHSVTGFAPKYLLDSTDVSILPAELKGKKEKNSWIEDQKLALQNTIKSHNYNKKLFDENREQYEFNIGDKVYVENGNRLNRRKLDEITIGPFEVLEKLSNSIYKIGTGRKKSDSTLFHITKLQPITKEEEDNDDEDFEQTEFL